MNPERLILGLLLALTFAIRAIRPDQPIVENYVGRQIPTAMVARNLERGSGFLHPQLDTGPFPNLFLVEPPIYAQVVAFVRPLLGFDLEPTGRLISASATVLAAWGLYGLVRRREGSRAALLALGSFCAFPVMIRYGRAFQPDALMLGAILAGLRGWDEFEESGDWRWAAFGGFVFSVGLALKITVIWAGIPFFLIVRRWSVRSRIAMLVLMTLPAMAWYLHAWHEVLNPGTGSLASSDNARVWIRLLAMENWLRFSILENLAQGLVLRSFTPVGFVLASGGLFVSGKLDRVWVGWGLGCLISILVLSGKWHHAYYWMVVAPLMAVGTGRVLGNLMSRGKGGKIGSFVLTLGFLAACSWQSASTWRTPSDWLSLREAGDLVEVLSSDRDLVIAPEAVLYSADRKGFRLEFDPSAARRAAGEWGFEIPDSSDPLALTEFYRSQLPSQFLNFQGDSLASGAIWIVPNQILVADVGLETTDGGRHAWRESIRRRPGTRILADRPDLMIAEIR